MRERFHIMDFGTIPTDETNVSFDYHVIAAEYLLGVKLNFQLGYPRVMKSELRLETETYDTTRI